MWRALGVLAVVLAAVMFGFAALHSGIWGPPVIVPAVVVEILCGSGLLAGGYGAIRTAPWAWNGLAYAYAGALGGVLLGVLALAMSPGASMPLTEWYHRVMAVVLALGLGGTLYASRDRK
ncbi:hypothetical protein [Nonomuraea typhae]|uniref:TIGR04086 family membrane protein n=1 Tax=Nonomuraea typhae TaxID=2603600 RepID=A0ABW7Z7L5_9ACTN